MQCPRCRHANEAGAKFCEECAAPLARACAKCGRPLSPTAKFCPDCAHPTGSSTAPTPAQRFDPPESYTPKHLAEKILTSKSALEGERKQVTVLFADLKGSMELLADRDPEEARKLLDPVLERMMEAVHHYEGKVNQVMGDGIMALFGAPIGHEDHAVRACYAALRMQRRVNLYADEIQQQGGTPVQIRVGLNSGEVVVRAIGSDLHMDYTAVGQTTHLAARMEQMAKPGSALGLRQSALALHGLACADYAPSLRSILGPTNQISVPGGFDVRLSTSTRQTAPFLNGIARLAPIRCAASSPSSGSWPTSAMRRRVAALASCAMTSRAVCPGASASSVFTGGLLSMPAARISAVCLARTSGLVKISSTAASSSRRPVTHSRKRLMPRLVSGRVVSSGHSSPRSAAMAWRTRYSSVGGTSHPIHAAEESGPARCGNARGAVPGISPPTRIGVKRSRALLEKGGRLIGDASGHL
jgi:class 3 adenylate cyclase